MGLFIMHTNDSSQKPNLPAMTTGESDARASMRSGIRMLEYVNEAGGEMRQTRRQATPTRPGVVSLS